jgi:LysM repeat protein
MKYIIFYSLFFLSIVCSAQTISSVVVDRNGKKYYLHSVKKQTSTLFSIAKEYNVNSDEILLLNPEISNGIREGQEILIPCCRLLPKPKNNSDSSSNRPKEKHYDYIVKEKETLYSISTKLSVSKESIIRLNPSVETIVSAGQLIYIPGVKPSDQILNKNVIQTRGKAPDTIILHTVLEHETMYSISKRFMITMEELSKLNKVTNTALKTGMVLSIPIYDKKAYNVSLRSISVLEKQTPIVLEESFHLAYDSTKKHLVTYLLPFNSIKKAESNSIIASEFWMGAQLAIDSLINTGFKGKVLVKDSGSDTSTVAAVLMDSLVLTSNMIIGPLKGESLDCVASFCKKKGILFVNPISNKTLLLKDNPFAHNASTSDITIAKNLARFVASTFSKDQIFLVKVGPKDDEMYETFKWEFNAATDQKIYEVDEKNLLSLQKIGKNKVFILLSREKNYTSMIVKELIKAYDLLKQSNSPISFTLIGTKEFLNYDFFLDSIKEMLNFHYASGIDFNLTEGKYHLLKIKYKHKYAANMTKFSTQGYDVSMYFVKYLIGIPPREGLMNDFHLSRVNDNAGFENKKTYIFRFDSEKGELMHKRVSEYND